MKTKKIVSVVMTCMLVIALLPICTKKAEAKPTDFKGFSIDKGVYDITWFESVKQPVYQNVSEGLWRYFNKGTTALGDFRVMYGIATSYTGINGQIYQKLLTKVEMMPRTVHGDQKGLSLGAKTTANFQAKYFRDVVITPESSQGQSSYSIGTSLNGNVSVSYDGLKLGGSGGLSAGISGTVNYTSQSLVVTTSKDAGDKCYWQYDYFPTESSYAQSAYCFGSSVQYGVLEFKTWDTRSYCGSVYFKTEVSFGGGEQSRSDLDIIEKIGTSKAKELGTGKFDRTIKMYVDYTDWVKK